MPLTLSVTPAAGVPDELPLFDWIAASPDRGAALCGSAAAARMPDRAPGPGEQYRFHFDMGRCIGCKCCVVACNEQNGNPASINWRRVGEIQGGWYPHATQSYLSMGCNHCLEPTCLQGCPVDAYSKDSITGLVRHSADACIGCQYCTWNCSYGVPQYNAERGVVGKCDMCHGRLSMDQSPACVSACPEGAIAIEIVRVADWRAAVASVMPQTGVPVDDGSLSTTRITLPADLPPDARPRDLTHVAPEHPHWPLVLMTVLTQLSVGAFVTVWLLQLVGARTRLDLAALTSLALGGLALGASTLHLGRPAYAYRALRMWRRSWLSREVLLFSAYSGVASVYAAMLWLGIPGSVAVGAATALIGAAGVTASACIYLVPSRPAWNSWHTIADFFFTGATLGPLFVAAAGAGDPRALGLATAAAAGGHLALVMLRVLGWMASDSPELKGTARLFSTRLAGVVLMRGCLLGLGAIVLPLAVPLPLAMAAALVIALAAQILGRYLFFVSVVPKHLAAPYLAAAREAA